MFDILANVVKAGVAVVASPVALVADIVTLPSTALDGKPAFGRTGKMLGAAGDCISEAVRPVGAERKAP
jgi:hypothetical protein